MELSERRRLEHRELVICSDDYPLESSEGNFLRNYVTENWYADITKSKDLCYNTLCLRRIMHMTCIVFIFACAYYITRQVRREIVVCKNFSQVLAVG